MSDVSFVCAVCKKYVEVVRGEGSSDPYEGTYEVSHECDCTINEKDIIDCDNSPYTTCSTCGTELVVFDTWDEEAFDEDCKWKEAMASVYPCPNCSKPALQV